MPEDISQQIRHRDLLRKATVEFRLRKYGEAIAMLRPAIAIDATPNALNLLASSLVEDARSTIRISGLHPEAEREQFMEAVQHYVRSLKVLPGQLTINSSIGKIYSDLEEHDDAIYYLQQEYELSLGFGKRCKNYKPYFVAALDLGQAFQKAGTIKYLQKAEGFYCAMALEAGLMRYTKEAMDFAENFDRLGAEIDVHPDRTGPV